MLGFEAARRIASGAADYMGNSLSSVGTGAPIATRELTGKDFSYGSAFANIGVKIMARARAEANASAASRVAQSASDLHDAQAQALREKMTAPPKDPNAGKVKVTGADGQDYYLTQDLGYKANNPTDKPDTHPYDIVTPTGRHVRGTAGEALSADTGVQRRSQSAGIAKARAQADFDANDAPVLGRRRDFLSGGNRPDGQPYSQGAKSEALGYFGIDKDAWAANDPGNFPENIDKNGKDTNAGARATAQSRRSTLLNAGVARFQKARIAQYSAKYMLGQGGNGTDVAAPTSDPNDDFEQKFIGSAPVPD